jgi:hypothetical protein
MDQFLKKCFFLVAVSFAGTAVANARNDGVLAVVCRDSEDAIKTAELYEFYASRLDWRIDLRLDKAPKGREEFLQYAMKRLEKISSMRSLKYPIQITNFFKNTRRYRNVHLPLRDLRDTVSPTAGCALEQALLYVHDPLPGQANYSLDEDIWSGLDGQGQAALLIHAVAQKEFWEEYWQGDIDKFVTTILSDDELSKLNTDRNVAKFFKDYGSSTDFHGFLGWNFEFYQEGQVKQFGVGIDEPYMIYGSETYIRSVTFETDGFLSGVNADKEYYDQFLKTYFWGDIKFHRNGRVKYAELASRNYVDPVSGKTYRWHITFDEQGVVVSGQ